MANFVTALSYEFARHQRLADAAMVQLSDEQFFARVAPHANSVAIIVKHLSGSMQARWTDFLTSDREQPGRDRDAEFIIGPDDTRGKLLRGWEAGWNALFQTLDGVDDAALERVVFIRNEPHTVTQALVRGLSHATYHVGQILYVARCLCPTAQWVTIPPGKSQEPRPGYLGGVPDRLAMAGEEAT